MMRTPAVPRAVRPVQRAAVRRQPGAPAVVTSTVTPRRGRRSCAAGRRTCRRGCRASSAWSPCWLSGRSLGVTVFATGPCRADAHRRASARWSRTAGASTGRTSGTTVFEAFRGWVWGNALAIVLAMLVLARAGRSSGRCCSSAWRPTACPSSPSARSWPASSSGDTPKVILAAMAVFFTTLIGMLVGLRSADPTSLDLVARLRRRRWQDS